VKIERYCMKNFKIIGLIVAFIASIGLYASQIQDQSTVQKSIDGFIELPTAEQKIQLFMYEDCFYCIKVTDFLKQYNLMDKVVLIDAGLQKNREQLRSVSGKTQAPYLVDFDANVMMPESLDIIAYLATKFNVIMPAAEVVLALPVLKIIEMTKYDSATFLSVVQASKKPVIILISTTWCPPCKIFKPIFLQIAQQFADACEFICIDGDADRAIADQLGVQCYPSIVCYKNGQQINPENYRSKAGLLNLIAQLIA
jgi:thioredoxin 1